jgi:hypothetical protein
LRTELDEDESIQPEKQPIAIYSKWAILGFSVFFSPVVGSVLLMLNLRTTGNKKAGYLVLLFGIAYKVITGLLLSLIIPPPKANATIQEFLSNPKLIYYSLAVDLLGAAILTEYFFKKYIPNSNSYERKGIGIPLLVIFGLTMLLGLLLQSIAIK